MKIKNGEIYIAAGYLALLINLLPVLFFHHQLYAYNFKISIAFYLFAMVFYHFFDSLPSFEAGVLSSMLGICSGLVYAWNPMYILSQPPLYVTYIVANLWVSLLLLRSFSSFLSYAIDHWNPFTYGKKKPARGITREEYEQLSLDLQFVKKQFLYLPTAPQASTEDTGE